MAISAIATTVVSTVATPGVARPFRAWGYPWSAAIVVAGALAFLISALIADTPSALVATGILAAGVVGHAVHRAIR